MIKQFYHTYQWSIFLAFAFGTAGWCYWYFIGCSSGICAITSSPIYSSIYGMVMGFIVGIKKIIK